MTAAEPADADRGVKLIVSRLTMAFQLASAAARRTAKCKKTEGHLASGVVEGVIKT
ncbi:hypothetical protein KCP78_19135 [Salmonella enterica subsp. enterica]|nr:hypothetical protein KCP78_19135 [Salmonella enterica subsp. enterica]